MFDQLIARWWIVASRASSRGPLAYRAGRNARPATAVPLADGETPAGAGERWELCTRKESTRERWVMRSRILVGTLFLVAVLGAGTVATSGDSLASPVRQRAIAYLTEPTLIGSTIVRGPVVFTHDNARMARGEPCTTVYLFEPMKGSDEEIASFHCVPTLRKAVHKFTITTRPNPALGYGCVMTEYQFAGDSEGHGVPPPVTYAH